MMIKSILVTMFLSILVMTTANANVIDNFESYANTTALDAAWSSGGVVSSYVLNTDHTNYMAISGNLGAGPNFGVVSKNLGGENWTGATTLSIDYRGTSGTTNEKLGIEIVDAANSSNKWQSALWAYPNDNTWHTQTIDISGVSWLNNVGPVNVVLKPDSWGTTTVGIDNIENNLTVPEPTSLLLLGSGLVGLLGFSKKKRV